MTDATSKEKINKINDAAKFLNALTDDENELITKYVELSNRRELIDTNIKGFKELFEDDLGLFELDTFKGYAILTSMLEKWRSEIQSEMDSMVRDISKFALRTSIEQYVVNVQNAVNQSIDDKSTNFYVSKFLDSKFGPDDSPSKAAMSSICMECVEYMISGIRSTDLSEVEKILNS